MHPFKASLIAISIGLALAVCSTEEGRRINLVLFEPERGLSQPSRGFEGGVNPKTREIDLRSNPERR